MRIAQRPGPLQELPLERFLPTNPNLPHSDPLKAWKSSKRPLSPGGPNLYSPAKRRILNEEGVFSPELMLKSPLSTTRGRVANPARFAQVLVGPDSPAKKLDFSPRTASSDATPDSSLSDTLIGSTPTRPSRRFAPSPELKPSTTRLSTPYSGSSTPDEDYFSIHSASASNPPSTLFVPRPIPPPSDPQSEHYPGFRIHRDPHIVTFQGVDFAPEVDRESIKENMPPRRKMRKAVTAPSCSEMKSDILSPELKRREVEKIGKAQSTPITPKSIFGTGGDHFTAMTPTPRRHEDTLTKRPQGSTPKLTEEQRRRMRRMLEDEVNGIESDDDD